MTAGRRSICSMSQRPTLDWSDCPELCPPQPAKKTRTGPFMIVAPSLMYGRPVSYWPPQALTWDDESEVAEDGLHR